MRHRRCRAQDPHRQQDRGRHDPEAEGAIAFFDPGTDTRKKRVVLNTSKPGAVIAAYFCHEMHHARMNISGKTGDALKDDKDAYVEKMVQEEADGTSLGFLCYFQLKGKGAGDRRAAGPLQLLRERAKFRPGQRCEDRGRPGGGRVGPRREGGAGDDQRPLPRPQQGAELRRILQRRLDRPASPDVAVKAGTAAPSHASGPGSGNSTPA